MSCKEWIGLYELKTKKGVDKFSANFSAFPWGFGGEAAWTIDTVLPGEGIYSAKSGVINDDETSEMILSVGVAMDGEISFFRKVSSENNYDDFRFYIDDVLQEEWNGEVPWGEVSYSVNAGNRTFKWHYYKDGSVSSGSDCAWIDYILIVPHPDITVTPISFDETLQPSGSSSDILTIGNLGGRTLDYTARVTYLERNVSLEDHTIFESFNDRNEYSSDREIKTPIIAPFIKEVPNEENRDCTFTIDLNDDYGDGWNGGLLDVLVNSSVVLDDITIDSGFGPISYDIPIATGDLVSTEYTAGSWGYENSYVIYDNDGVQVASDGTGGVEPTGISPFAVTCTNDPTLSWLTLDGLNQISGSISSGSPYEEITILFNTVPDGLTVGVYEANIAITSNDPDEPLITVPVTLTVGVIAPPDVPQNVTITTTPNGAEVDVQISWSDVPGITSYTVYRSSDPSADFPSAWTPQTVIGETSWSYTTSRTQRFYRVSANN